MCSHIKKQKQENADFLEHLSPTFFMAFILLAAVGAQWLAWRTRLPAIVILSVFGVVLGPVLGILEPKAQMGDSLKYLVSFAVAVVLFNGGLSLRLEEIKETRKAILRLVCVGGPLAWFLATLGAHYVVGLSWPVATLFGGILVVTGPTVIMPMLRQAKLNVRVGNMLKWEGIVIDPLGAMFAVITYEVLTSPTMETSLTAGAVDLTLIIVFITILSFYFGRMLAWLLRDDHLPEYLKGPVVLTALLLAYTLANIVLDEGGLIAVTVLGAALANAKISSMNDIRHVKEYLSVILVSLLFILLTATLTWQDLTSVTWRDGLFLLLLLLVVRPLSVWLSTARTSLSQKERTLLSFVAPRGVVLVAICGLFGPLLVEAGYPDGARLIPLSFAVVFATVLVYGFSVKPLAKTLDLTARRSGGVLIVGSNLWSLHLAKELQENKIPVLISDDNWHRLRKARLADIPVHYGEIVSSTAEHKIEFNLYNKLVAATDNYAYNALVCSRFSHVFGRMSTFQLASDDHDESDPEAYCHTVRGLTFMNKDAHYDLLQKRIRDGWQFSTITLSEDYGFQDVMRKNAEHMFIVGVLDQQNELTFNTQDAATNNDLKPTAGQSVIIFAPPKEPQQEQAQGKNKTV